MSRVYKMISISLLAVLLCLSLLAFPKAQSQPRPLAESDTEQSADSHLYDAYTDDDFFTWENETYTIQDYSASLKNQMFGAALDPDLPDLFGSTAEYASAGRDALDVAAYGNDPIVEIVPEELFAAEGQTLYIGREYGFYIFTEQSDPDSDALYSTVLLFDLVNETDPDQTNDRLIFSVQVLFEVNYVCLPAGTASFETTEEPADGPLLSDSITVEVTEAPNEAVVIPLKYYIMGSPSHYYEEAARFSLQDISFSGVLANEQGLNEGDIGYDVDEDEGPFFIRMDYFFDGIKSLKSTGLADEEIAQIVFSCMNFVLGLIPDLGTMMSIIETGVEIGTIVTSALDTKEFDVNNQNVIYDCYRTTGPKQIEDYGELMRGADANIDSNGEEYFQFLAGDWAEAQFTVGDSSHDAAGSPGRIYRRIELKVRDRCADTVMATSVSQYGFGFNEDGAEDLSLAEPALMALLPEDGINRFDFTPDYGGVYEWLPEGVDLSALTCTVDGVPVSPLNGKFLSQLTADHTYRIEIASDSAERQIGAFRVRPTTDLTGITLAPGETTVVTLPFTQPRAVNLSSSDPAFSFLDWVYAGEQLNLTRAYAGMGILQEEEAYVYIRNTSDQTQTGDLIMADEFPELELGENSITFTDYPVFYQFQAQPASYQMSWTEPAMVRCYNENYESILGGAFDFLVEDTGTVYIMIQGEETVETSFSLEMDDSGFS